jgi:LysM repeat protein
LESGAGKSALAKNSNNHFGIKCHNDWTGEKVYQADDTPNDCFRKYKNVEESFDDHAAFLDKARYKSLFSLDITDYKGWAKGLQQSGYATDRAYANKLIKLIEDYELYQFDKKGFSKEKIKEIEVRKGVIKEFHHTPYKTYGLVYIIAEDGDTYESIATEFGFKVKDISKFNEAPQDFPLKAGDLVYFEKKKSKADKPYYEHVVQVGESMHSISQLYGIKLDNLYKMNKKGFEYTPVEGTVLKLR